MSEDKRFLVKKETLEKIAQEMGFPIDKIDFEKLLADALPLFVQYIKEKNRGKNVYFGKPVAGGVVSLRRVDYEKYLSEYILIDKEVEN